MSLSVEMKYFGWSCFSIASDKGHLLFDPFFRPMHGAKWATLEDFRETRVICVTHGHYEHYLDTAPIAHLTGATVISSKEICDHLATRHKLDRRNLLPVKPFESVDVLGFKVTAFEFRHRNISFWKFFKGDILTALQFTWHGLLEAPFQAPKFGFLVEGAGGYRLMNYNEGFNNLARTEELADLGQRFKPDIVLAGMQLNFEDYLAAGIGALMPKTVVLFHPHEKLFEKFRLKSSSPETFIEGIKRALPSANVVVPKPMSSFEISLNGLSR